jgi:hypothetical protein
MNNYKLPTYDFIEFIPNPNNQRETFGSSVAANVQRTDSSTIL